MLGSDDILDNMMDVDLIMTFIFVITFYIFVTSILLNMFWVFTKNALEDFVLKKIEHAN